MVWNYKYKCSMLLQKALVKIQSLFVYLGGGVDLWVYTKKTIKKL